MLTKLVPLVVYLLILPFAYADEAYVSVYMDIKNNKEIIYIDGKLTKTEDILQAFVGYKHIRETEVSVYFNDKLSFSTVGNMRGILGKVGFSNIAYFAFSDGGNKVSKIEFNGVYDLPDKFIRRRNSLN